MKLEVPFKQILRDIEIGIQVEDVAAPGSLAALCSRNTRPLMRLAEESDIFKLLSDQDGMIRGAVVHDDDFITFRCEGLLG